MSATTEQSRTSDRFIELLRGCWGAPDIHGETHLTMEGVKVGAISIRKAGPGVAWVSTLHLDVEHQGKGIGSQVIGEICGLADATGCSLSLEAFSRPDVPGGGRIVEFWRHQGFHPVSGPDADGYLEMTRSPFPTPGAPPAKTDEVTPTP